MAEIMRRTALGKVSVWRCQERHIERGVDPLLLDKTTRPRIPHLADAKVPEMIRQTQEEAPPDGDTHTIYWLGLTSPETLSPLQPKRRKLLSSFTLDNSGVRSKKNQSAAALRSLVRKN